MDGSAEAPDPGASLEGPALIVFANRTMYSAVARGAKMAKKKRRTASRRKPRRAITLAGPKLQVPISVSKATIQEVEAAIANQLATQPTDLFVKNEKVIIEVEQFENKGHEGG